MPNGHTLTFNWNQNVNGLGLQRITSVSDNGGRTVQYGYTNGYLTSVTTPGGKETTYNYNGVYECYAGGIYPVLNPPSTLLFTDITDPRGPETQIQYYEDHVQIAPYGAMVSGAVTTAINCCRSRQCFLTW